MLSTNLQEPKNHTFLGAKTLLKCAILSEGPAISQEADIYRRKNLADLHYSDRCVGFMLVKSAQEPKKPTDLDVKTSAEQAEHNRLNESSHSY